MSLLNETNSFERWRRGINNMDRVFVRKIVLVLVSAFCSITMLTAMELSTDTSFTAGSGELPLWLHANNWGVFEDDEAVQWNSGVQLSQRFDITDMFWTELVGDGIVRVNTDSDLLLRQAYAH